MIGQIRFDVGDYNRPILVPWPRERHHRIGGAAKVNAHQRHEHEAQEHLVVVYDGQVGLSRTRRLEGSVNASLSSRRPC